MDEPLSPTALWWRALRRSGDEAFLARWLFLRLLGLVYLVAFVSFWVQAEGLVGSEGIWPVATTVETLGALEGAGAGPAYAPSLIVLAPGDGALHLVCLLGTLAAAGLVAGLVPAVLLPLLWLLYLSLVVVGGPFLAFQWDTLLLEAGLASCLLAPAGLWPRPNRERSPPSGALLVLWLLLFKLMLLSGVVKLLSRDDSWRDLTALSYHWWTQPLPTWTAWYANRLPLAADVVLTAGMFGVELLLPLVVFTRWPLRRAAFWGFAGLQIGIALTGNYGFFNLLTLALCVLLVPDASLERWFPGRLLDWLQGRETTAPFRRGPAAGRALAVAAALWAALSLFGGAVRYLPSALRAGPVRSLYAALAPLRSFNDYGLFAVMTRERDEIRIEGSRDGSRWEPYVFKWKPGPPERRPRFVQPHMPRLDWQMWFAALGSCRTTPWIVELQERLLEGSEPVLALLDENPFAGEPPRFVRARIAPYRFASPEARDELGLWWARGSERPYCPVLTLDKSGRVVPAR